MSNNEMNLKWCTSCLTMSTRPRIEFDETGRCNACLWHERKKNLNWLDRHDELLNLLNKFKNKNKNFDCIVPVSGGKDGSYVSYQLKNKYKINPLCVTVSPPLPTPLGEKNLKAFVECGFSHISINCPHETMRMINKIGFIEKGFPYYGWLIAIHTAVLRISALMDIPLIFYGEDGEVEYGGSTETSKSPYLTLDYIKRVWLEDGDYEKLTQMLNLDQKDLYFFKFPDLSEFKTAPCITTWSYFENWDPYRNYLVAKQNCGLQELNESNIDTFTNFAQNDQYTYALHTYLMYLKFGFGRANQDASIEIRRGAMDRNQAVNLVKLYDGNLPEELIAIYLTYYKMSREEFNLIIDKWVNKKLFKKENNKWTPLFEIK